MVIKNTKIDTSSLKLKVQLKAHENLHLFFDILFEMNETSNELGYIENPIEFIRNNVIYILVCSQDKNIREADLIRKSKMMHREYIPGFMEELNNSIFKESYILTEKNFYREFIRN